MILGTLGAISGQTQEHNPSLNLTLSKYSENSPMVIKVNYIDLGYTLYPTDILRAFVQ